MDMPSKEKGCITAKGDGANERFPFRVQQEAYEEGLSTSVYRTHYSETSTYNLKAKGQKETGQWNYFRKYGEGCITDQSPGHTIHCFRVDFEPKMRSRYTLSVLHQPKASKNEVSPYIRTRSLNEYNAQTFGAQYAWQSPRENGKSRRKTCSSCPHKAKGPNAAAKTPTIPTPSLMQLRNCIWK